MAGVASHGSRRRPVVAGALFAVAAAVGLASGCSGPAASPSSNDATAAARTGVEERVVDIGGGRLINVVCVGQGSPTVVLIPGSQGSHEVWQVVPDRDAPDSYVPSDRSVFATLGQQTRVCSYDRPGVPLLDGTMSASTLVPQPTTAQQGADDVAAWLTAAGEEGPYLVVAHSWGGLIATRFAQVHPEDVAGLVLVDPASVQLRDALTDEQWQAFLGIIGPMLDGTEREAPDYAGTVDVVAQGPPVPTVPSVILTSDRPFNYGIGESGTWPAWLTAQARLAAALDAEHVTRTDSGHLIMIEQPETVSRAILGVLEQVRS